MLYILLNRLLTYCFIGAVSTVFLWFCKDLLHRRIIRLYNPTILFHFSIVYYTVFAMFISHESYSMSFLLVYYHHVFHSIVQSTYVDCRSNSSISWHVSSYHLHLTSVKGLMVSLSNFLHLVENWSFIFLLSSRRFRISFGVQGLCIYIFSFLLLQVITCRDHIFSPRCSSTPCLFSYLLLLVLPARFGTSFYIDSRLACQTSVDKSCFQIVLPIFSAIRHLATIIYDLYYNQQLDTYDNLSLYL